MLLAHCVFCVCSTDQTQILMFIQISGILDSTTHERFALSKSSEHLTRLSQLCHSWTCSVTCTTSLRGIKISEMAQFRLENLAILLPWWTTLNLAKSFLVTTPTTSLLSLHTSMCRWKKILTYEIGKYILTKPKALNLLKIWGSGVEASMMEGVGFITGLKSMW